LTKSKRAKSKDQRAKPQSKTLRSNDNRAKA
jgi:hypothetical protein